MKYQELMNKSVSELNDSLISIKKELLGLRVQKSLGQLSFTASIRRNRKDVARIKTRLSQLNENKRS